MVPEHRGHWHSIAGGVYRIQTVVAGEGEGLRAAVTVLTATEVPVCVFLPRWSVNSLWALNRLTVWVGLESSGIKLLCCFGTSMFITVLIKLLKWKTSEVVADPPC